MGWLPVELQMMRGQCVKGQCAIRHQRTLGNVIPSLSSWTSSTSAKGLHWEGAAELLAAGN